jgi:hypothetical protein
LQQCRLKSELRVRDLRSGKLRTYIKQTIGAIAQLTKVCAQIRTQGFATRALLNGQVTKDVLFATGQGIAPCMASVTFGAPDLQTVYIGSLRGSRIPYFLPPVAGLPMAHCSEHQCV